MCQSQLWKGHFLTAIFFAILKNEKIGSLAALWPALLLFWVLLQICSIEKRQNVNSSGHGVGKDTCFTVLKMAEKMAIRKWHFEHPDGHATEKVRKKVHIF